MLPVLVTGNPLKVKEFNLVLKEFKLKLKSKNLELIESTGKTLKEIAKEKAEQAFQQLKKPVVVDDTGVFFRIYENFPGTESKRIFEKEGYKGILKKLESKPRTAYFKTVLCLMEGIGKQRFFEGVLEGTISEKVFFKNKKVLPYDRIFIPKGKKKVLAAFSLKEKTRLSSRGMAVRLLGKYLKSKKQITQ
jgi:non-canonical purine NTP pyrophosphatase (RdgB/HAM1 family)